MSMEQCCKRLLGKMTKTALLSVFFTLFFLGGIGQASEIYIEKSIWNDDQAVYEDIERVINNDSDWYLKGCNTTYLGNHYNGDSYPNPYLLLAGLTLHAELGKQNLNKAILSFEFFGYYSVLMEWVEIKWDITASADLEEYGNGMLSLYYNHPGSQVPEPGAAGLSLLGLAAALWRRRRE